MGLLETLNKQRIVVAENAQEQENALTSIDEQPEIEEYVDPYEEIKEKLRQETVILINDQYASAGNISKEEFVTKTIKDLIEQREYKIAKVDETDVINSVRAEIIGLGPIEKLLNDDNISEVMVNGPKKIYVEEKGKLTLSNVKFKDNAHVMTILDRIVSPLGRHVDESSPMVDARLADGSRVNAVIPPLALDGPTITIRKFPKNPIRAKDLLKFGSVSPKMLSFLEACVKGRMNIIVSGGTGSGKTTLLGVLSGFIPNDERIVTIEDAAELQLQQEHVVRLESRPANTEGTGRIAIKDLVVNALRMRPDRIVVGECRGGEALDMLQAMNTGHDGSLTTGHANSPRDMVARLETMVMMSGMALPDRAIREQISSAINLIVQQSRLRDGSRKITNITEVCGMENDEVVLQDIFVFKADGLDANGKLKGKFEPTGIRPQFEEKLEASGIRLQDDWFLQ